MANWMKRKQRQRRNEDSGPKASDQPPLAPAKAPRKAKARKAKARKAKARKARK